MLSFWYKNLSRIPVHHSEFHRAKLIYHLLLFVCILAALLTVLNLILFDAIDIAAIDALGLAFAMTIYWYFRRSGNVKVTGWAITVSFIVIVWAFLTVWNGNNYGIIWATLIPPVAFFLLGRSMGTLVSVVFFSYATYIVYGHVQAGLTYKLSLAGLLNVVEVLIAHIMLFRFYERTRADAMLQVQQSREHLQIIANTDKLTGLNNRQRFDEQLKGLVLAAERSHQPFALVLIDIDHFKHINDEFGHLFGDTVLQELARHLQKNLRHEDFLARWGGEEFAILMPDTSTEEAFKLAERLRKSVADTSICNQPVTFSGGVASWTPGLSAETLLGKADRALYQAKENGRNRIELHQQH